MKNVHTKAALSSLISLQTNTWLKPKNSPSNCKFIIFLHYIIRRVRQCLVTKMSHKFKTSSFPRIGWQLLTQTHFYNRLVRSGMSDVTVHIEPGLPHGFMSYNSMSVECQAAVDRITSRLKDFLKLWPIRPTSNLLLLAKNTETA